MASGKHTLVNYPDFKNQLMKYVKYWYLFLLGILLSTGIAYAYLKITTPLYKVTSTLLIQEDTKGDGLLKGTAFSDLNLFKTSKTVDNEMEVLRSRDLIYKVLKGLELETSYFYDLPFGKKELYGNSLPVKVKVTRLNNSAYTQKLTLNVMNDGEFILGENGITRIYKFGQIISRPAYRIQIIKGPAFAISGKTLQLRFLDLHKSAEAYSTKGIVILPIVKDANTIVITLFDALPQRGVDILNRLIDTYNQENVSNKNLMAINTIKFIDTKLKVLTDDLSGAEQDVESYKRYNNTTELGADAQLDLQSSGNYGQQLATSEVQLSLVQSIISYLKDGNSNFELVPSTLGLKDPTLQNLTEKYNNLQIERQRLLRSNSVDNPLVVNLTEQLVGLKSNLLENLNVIRRGLQLEKNKLNSKSSQLASKLNNVPVIERGLLERNREQSVKTILYHYLLQKREETELSLSATIPTSQIIDKPAYSFTPAKPRVQLIYMLSLIAGFFIPLSVIYGRDKMNSKVKDIYDTEYIAGHARILGTLSHKTIGTSIVVHKDKSTTISELFRYIRSNLHFMDSNKENKVLLITSTTKGEGKTFFSINLGITLSLINKKVVVLEFDLRKPDLLQGMQLTSELGLSDYLRSDILTVEDVLKPMPAHENLFAIGCGEIPEDPSELLMNGKIRLLFHELRKRFDYIIVDTPPVGHVADAFTLAQFSDASIYLVRYNFTNKTDLDIFEEICLNNRLKNPMVVFNDAKKEHRNTYRYGRYALPE